MPTRISDRAPVSAARSTHSERGKFARRAVVLLDLDRRITHVSISGTTVRDDDKILVATNNYRASGGGGYEFLKGKPDHVGDRIIPIQSVLEDFLMARGPIRDLPHAEWSFAAPDEAEAFQELQRQSAPSSKSNSQESLKTKANQPT